jgi:rhodanese-related sulfurtransferase
MSGMFAAENLTSGIFATLPPAHIEELLRRFQRIKAPRGEVIIREGEEGDFYYVIESGRCTVSRQVGGASVELAELKAGDAFGEEALVANARRNATVAMKTDGVLLRLAKADFVELLKEPLMHRLSRPEADKKAAAGAVWLDVRFPAEYNVDKLPGAMNIPLNEIRNVFGSLDRHKEYIVYCQSGRRSSAAAFLLSQRGFKAYLLEGGLRGHAA